MRSARNSRIVARLLALVGLGWAAACGGSPPREAAAAAKTPPPAATQGGAMPHGDHNPHHGGIVMMKGDVHYEVVLDPDGRDHRVYFTDAVREDLPASVARDVTLTIRRPAESEEIVHLRIDDAGESWEGSGLPVSKPRETTVRVAFTLGGEPYWIDLPFARD
jgi:hypothetical protein